jgi:phosphoglycolate phosphatase
MRLILFDIDGTLIQLSGVGKQVMGIALDRVFGTTGPINDYSFAGKTDRRIIQDLLKAAGVPSSQIATGLPSVYKYMAITGEILFEQDGLVACPGVSKLMRILSQRQDVALGLQTGNIRATAHQKLRSAKIDPLLFRIGAYGSDAADRVGLLPIAWQRACQQLNVAVNASDIVVIGDTPADIECAKVIGAVAIGVATGSFSFDSLARYHPNYLITDFLDTEY